MPEYDRELIARMLLGPRVFSPESVAEQASLLREADNLEADARTVVREVPEGMALERHAATISSVGSLGTSTMPSGTSRTTVLASASRFSASRRSRACSMARRARESTESMTPASSVPAACGYPPSRYA